MIKCNICHKDITEDSIVGYDPEDGKYNHFNCGMFIPVGRITYNKDKEGE